VVLVAERSRRRPKSSLTAGLSTTCAHADELRGRLIEQRVSDAAARTDDAACLKPVDTAQSTAADSKRVFTNVSSLS